MEKNSIYLDIDDDIATIISKVTKSDHKSISLVVPKRSNALQSVVNLKLIQRSAAAADKKVALITDDSKINTIASRLDMLTAPNLQVEPSVPVKPTGDLDLPSDLINEDNPVETPLPTGKAGKAVAPAQFAGERSAGETAVAGLASARGLKKTPAAAAVGGKKPKVPDFDRFRKRLIIIGLVVIVFIAGLIWMAKVLPKASITIKGRTEPLPTEFVFSVDTQAKKVDQAKVVIPGVSQELAKTLTATFAATGQKDLGTKASGNMVLTNCDEDDETITVAAGNTVSSGSLNFITTEAATIPPSNFTGGGACKNDSQKTVGVVAQNAGDQYNLAPRSYAVSGHASIKASGNQMSGGTSKVIKIITQADVDKAKTELLEKERPNSQKELVAKFKEGLYLIPASFTENATEVTANPSVGAEGDQATLIVKASYSEFAATTADLKALLRGQELKELKGHSGKLGVANEGLDKATITAKDSPSATLKTFTIKTDALAGPDINPDELKKQLAGKGYSETIKQIEGLPNVTHADVKFSPFWVRHVPKDGNKVTIKFEVPTTR